MTTLSPQDVFDSFQAALKSGASASEILDRFLSQDSTAQQESVLLQESVKAFRESLNHLEGLSSLRLGSRSTKKLLEASRKWLFQVPVESLQRQPNESDTTYIVRLSEYTHLLRRLKAQLHKLMTCNRKCLSDKTAYRRLQQIHASSWLQKSYVYAGLTGYGATLLLACAIIFAAIYGMYRWEDPATSMSTSLQLFWISPESPEFSEASKKRVEIQSDGQLAVYPITLEEPVSMHAIRLDPTEFQIEEVELFRIEVIGSEPSQQHTFHFEKPNKKRKWTLENLKALSPPDGTWRLYPTSGDPYLISPWFSPFPVQKILIEMRLVNRRLSFQEWFDMKQASLACC